VTAAAAAAAAVEGKGLVVLEGVGGIGGGG